MSAYPGVLPLSSVGAVAGLESVKVCLGGAESTMKAMQPFFGYSSALDW
jgi:hypothetical protein